MKFAVLLPSHDMYLLGFCCLLWLFSMPWQCFCKRAHCLSLVTSTKVLFGFAKGAAMVVKSVAGVICWGLTECHLFSCLV